MSKQVPEGRRESFWVDRPTLGINHYLANRTPNRSGPQQIPLAMSWKHYCSRWRYPIGCLAVDI